MPSDAAKPDLFQDPGHDLVQNGVQRGFRLESQKTLRLFHAGHALLHVVGEGGVGGIAEHYCPVKIAGPDC